MFHIWLKSAQCRLGPSVPAVFVARPPALLREFHVGSFPESSVRFGLWYTRPALFKVGLLDLPSGSLSSYPKVFRYMVYDHAHKGGGVGMSTAALLKVHENWPEWRLSVQVR